MKANPLENQLEKLARTLTEKFGVQVICQGDNAWTNGKQIVLPSLPDPMEKALERMMVGYLDHEMAHVAFSDFGVVERFSKKHPGAEGLLNVVEDALIEKRAMQRWPGVRANLDAMFSQIRDRVKKLIAQRSPFDRFCTGVYLKLAHYQDMMGLESDLVGYEDLLDRFDAVGNTHQAADLAEALLDRWRSKHPPQVKDQAKSDAPPSLNDGDGEKSSGCDDERSKSDQQDDQNGNQQSDQNGDDSGQGNGDSESPQPESDQNRQDDCDQNRDGISSQDARSHDGSQMPSDSKETDDAANGSDAASTQDGNTSDRPDEPEAGENAARNPAGQGGLTVVGEALAEAIAERVADFDGTRDYRVFTQAHDRIEILDFAGNQAVQALLASGVDAVRRLRRGLANALRAAEKRWWRDDQLRGHLSPRTLHRLCMDRPRLDVFRTRSMVQGRSTAVSIALDASGSMSVTKMNVARESMRVLLEALGDLKIPTEAFTFTTGKAFTLDDARKQTGSEVTELRSRFGRFSNLEIGLIKRFNEPVKHGLRRLPLIRGTGLTPLGEAIQVGASRLVVRSEFRKILLVLTDGKPGCEGGAECALLHAIHQAEKVTKAGIELVGVGILHDSLCAIVKDTIVVYELKDLPAQLIKTLGRTLQKGLRHVG